MSRAAPVRGLPLAAVAVLLFGVAADGAFPGRNGRIAYVECTGTCAGLCQIKTVAPDGTDPKTLVSGREPAWSPSRPTGRSEGWMRVRQGAAPTAA